MRNASRLAAASLATAGLAVAAFAANPGIAHAQAGAPAAVYACVHQSSQLVRIVGPQEPCRAVETRVQWSVAGPPGSGAGPMSLTVDCSAGRTLNAALAEAASATTVMIRFTGVCRENVTIRRDDVTIGGWSSADVLEAPDPNLPVLTVAGGRRVILGMMTIRGGSTGVNLVRGAGFRAVGLVVSGARTGMIVGEASLALLETSAVEDSGSMGVDVNTGGQVWLSQSAVRRSTMHGVTMNGGGTLTLTGSTVEQNGWSGIYARDGDAVNMTGSRVANNLGSGISLHQASLFARGGNAIADNGDIGIGSFGARIQVGATVIERNRMGIAATGGTSVLIDDNAIIQNNQLEGLNVLDTSVVGTQAGNGIRITGNGSWGIYCQASPAVAQISGWGGPSLNGTHVFGNAGGQINCPGIILR
jgi:hypothetical protein